jgi:glutamine amidotransferase
MSAAVDAGAEGALRAFRLRGGRKADNPDGWGLAYRQGEAFRIHKEPEPAAESARFRGLCQEVRSSLIVAHVRKAKYPPVRGLLNTHPFTSTCCGREWVFAHNGLVPEVVELERASGNPICRPAGETDSEHAFCHLLSHIAERFREGAPGDSKGWFETLAAASEMVASHGKFNFLMSDGEHLIAYGHDRLHFLEGGAGWPPDPGASHAVLIATEPLDDDGRWIPFQPGELRVYRRGSLAGKIVARAHCAPRDASRAAVENAVRR